MFTGRKVPPSPRSTYSRVSVPVTSHSSARFPDCLPPTSREQPTTLQKPTVSRCTRCSHSPPRPLQHPPRPGDATCLLGKLALATADLHPRPSPPSPHGGGPCSSAGSREEKGPTPSSHTVIPPPRVGIPRKHSQRGLSSQDGAVDAMVSVIGEGETHRQRFCLAPADPP